MFCSRKKVVRLATLSITAALLLAAGQSFGQTYRPDSYERPEAAPSRAMGMSPASVHALNHELDADFQAPGGFKRVGNFARPGVERPGPWVLYGRFYVLNFQNRLGEGSMTDTEVGFRRTGPSIAGRTYIGIRRRF